MTKYVTALLLGLLVFLSTASQELEASNLTNFEITIDWVPSPEYYGFFYARERGFYDRAGLHVTIKSGTGAPGVAKQLLAQTIYAGTTTSDNLLKVVAEGARIGSATRIMAFNPCVIASLQRSPISSLSDLKGKTLGTNPQASVYQQLMWLVNSGRLPASYKEDPTISYGGAAHLLEGRVNAILAYTTNVVVDLESKGHKTLELFFGDFGVINYGLILVLADKDRLAKENITSRQANLFIKATLDGYTEGFRDLPGAIRALRKDAPILDQNKLDMAIQKIGRLNERTNYKLDDLDKWVTDKNITLDTRKKALLLYK